MLGVTTDDDVVILELQRESRRNALDIELCRQLHEAVDAAVGGGARAIVITGKGSAFCSGADLNGVYGDEFLGALYGMLHRLAAVPVPLLAAVNGAAIGAGTQLALACDLRIADSTAKFGVPTIRNGLAVDAWTIRTLADLAGHGPARRLMLAAETFDRDQALSCGLVDRSGTLADAVRWAHELAAFAPLAYAHNKLILGGGSDAAVAESFARCWASEDVKESAAARAAKRTPVFVGR